MNISDEGEATPGIPAPHNMTDAQLERRIRRLMINEGYDIETEGQSRDSVSLERLIKRDASLHERISPGVTDPPSYLNSSPITTPVVRKHADVSERPHAPISA